MLTTQFICYSIKELLDENALLKSQLAQAEAKINQFQSIVNNGDEPSMKAPASVPAPSPNDRTHNRGKNLNALKAFVDKAIAGNTSA